MIFSTEIFGDYSYEEMCDKVNNFIKLVNSIDKTYFNRSENVFLNIIKHYCNCNFNYSEIMYIFNLLILKDKISIEEFLNFYNLIIKNVHESFTKDLSIDNLILFWEKLSKNNVEELFYNEQEVKDVVKEIMVKFSSLENYEQIMGEIVMNRLLGENLWEMN